MRTLLKILIGVVAACLLYVNVKIYYQPDDIGVDGKTINRDVLQQARYLRESLSNRGAEDMQRLYPEGYVFFNALYGLTWSELVTGLNPSSELYKEGHSQITHAYKNISSSYAKEIFDVNTTLSYGAFYCGWRSYLLGKKLNCESVRERQADDIGIFKNQCDSIAIALSANAFPDSYLGQAWPADAVVCVSALALHDKMFAPKYHTTIRKWVKEVKKQLDDRGMIPHKANVLKGNIDTDARGSSMSLMLVLLQDIDPVLASVQFSLYKQNFISHYFGIPVVREYPNGVDGAGDVDSGPLIFEIGPSATIVGSRTLSTFNQVNDATLMRNGVEAFGFPLTFSGRKRYLFGALPIADAFIAWSQAGKIVSENSMGDRNIFHAYSMGLMVCLASVFWVVSKRKRSGSSEPLD